MRFDAAPVALQPETTVVFKRLQNARVPLPVYGLAPDQVATAVRAITDPVFEGAEIPQLRVLQYRWYVNDFMRVLRTRTGHALVFQLELILRKWVAFGLESEAIQFLLRAVVERLEAETEPETASEAPAPGN